MVVISFSNYWRSIHLFFWLPFDKPEAPAFWATLTLWILNISMAITAWADYHAVFLGLEGFSAHLSLICDQPSL
jgi:hypothetical protein